MTPVSHPAGNGLAQLWDVASGREIAALRGVVGLSNPSFSPDGARVVTVSDDNTVRVWDAATGREIAALRGHRDSVNSAAFGPDGSYIVTASRDGTAQVWSAAGASDFSALRGHESDVLSAAFSPDGARILTVSEDSTARMWDAATGREVAILRLEPSVASATFSPDGAYILTVSTIGNSRLWDTDTGREIAGQDWHNDTAMEVLTAVVSADGIRIAFTHKYDFDVDRAYGYDRAAIWVLNTRLLLRSGWRQRPGMPFLAEVACADTGALAGEARFITQADAEATPILRGHVGEDVCATPLTWESLRHELLERVGIRSRQSF